MDKRKRKAARKKIRQKAGSGKRQPIPSEAREVHRILHEHMNNFDLDAILTQVKKDPHTSLSLADIERYATGEEFPANGHLFVLMQALEELSLFKKPEKKEPAPSDSSNDEDTLKSFWIRVKGTLFDEETQPINERIEQVAQLAGITVNRLTKYFRCRVEALDNVSFEQTGKVNIRQGKACELKPHESFEDIRTAYETLESKWV